MKNLEELTGHSCGIVIHPEKTIIVCNWGRDGDGIPVLSPSPIDLPLNWDFGEFEAIEKKRLENIIEYLGGGEVIYDGNNEIGTMCDSKTPTQGVLYILNNGIEIIVPDEWC